MRKVSNFFIGLAAAGVCAFVTYLAIDANILSLIYNLVVLGIMFLIILFAVVIGFSRMSRTRAGLDRAADKLMDIHDGHSSLSSVMAAGSELFGVRYLDEKYQEYLSFLRKTNSPCDIGEYIGEYEIRNYTHRRMLDMVPDILTSLGILGTFLGLVWGLRGFDPVSYEAMTGSVSSLISGIKVAFITSIYGLSLSIAFSYWLRGAVSDLSESLDNFLDKYYLCAVPPTDTSAMNHVLSNQKEQIKALNNFSTGITDQIAVDFEEHIDPALGALNETMANFTDVVTLNQEKLLENIADQVMRSIKTEYMTEMTEMRTMLKESNRAQKEHIQVMAELQQRYREDFIAAEQEMARAMNETAAMQAETSAAVQAAQEEAMESMRVQQEHLKEFVGYMSQIMKHMSDINAQAEKTLEAATARVGEVSFKAQSEEMDEMNQNLEHLIAVIERSQRQQAKKKKGILPF